MEAFSIVVVASIHQVLTSEQLDVQPLRARPERVERLGRS